MDLSLAKVQRFRGLGKVMGPGSAALLGKTPSRPRYSSALADETMLKLAMLTEHLRLMENGAPDRLRYPKKSQYIQCFSDDGTKRNVAKLLE